MKELFMILVVFVSSLAYAGIAQAVVQCKCGDEGVTLTVVSGCKDWNDATECTGWASVAHENGKSENDNYPDKSQLTAFECTIQINCPSQDAKSDAGTTTTEEKKEDDSGWCSILSLN